MAPEQAVTEGGALSPATDVYALGAILYEALTGRPPFFGPNKAELLQRVRDTEPLPPTRLNAAIPTRLEAVCLKCLAKAPEKRYASAAALARDLHGWLNQ